MPDDDRDKIQVLAVRVFSKHTPVDPTFLPEPYMKCLDMGTPYKACVLTGRYFYYYWRIFYYDEYHNDYYVHIEQFCSQMQRCAPLVDIFYWTMIGVISSSVLSVIIPSHS
jgi:hypothetical protein